MESDHRTGFVDFDEIELSGENTEDATHNATRQLSTDYPESIEKYLQHLRTKIKTRKLANAIAKLQKIPAKNGNHNMNADTTELTMNSQAS